MKARGTLSSENTYISEFVKYLQYEKQYTQDTLVNYKIDLKQFSQYLKNNNFNIVPQNATYGLSISSNGEVCIGNSTASHALKRARRFNVDGSSSNKDGGNGFFEIDPGAQYQSCRPLAAGKVNIAGAPSAYSPYMWQPLLLYLSSL